jgi:membrane protein
MDPVERVSLRSVWKLLLETTASWSRINAPRLGAALAFYTMWSIAPLLVLCVSIAGLVFGPEAAQHQVAQQIQNIAGPVDGEAVPSVLAHAANPGHSFIAALIGLIILLCGASSVFGELRDSLNLIWGVE